MVTVQNFLLAPAGAFAAPVPGWWVGLLNTATNTGYVATALTDTQGFYSIPTVPAGTYSIWTSLTGGALSGPTPGVQWIANEDTNFVVSDPFDSTFTNNVDPNAVHLAGTETITGAKTVNARLTLQKDFVHSSRTATETELVLGLDASLAETVYVTLTAARIMGAPINGVAGHRMKVVLIENGTGGWTLDTSNAALSITNWALNRSANAITELPLELNGNTNKWLFALNPPSGLIRAWGPFFDIKAPQNPNGPANGGGVIDDTSSVHGARDAAGANGEIYGPPGIYPTANGFNANVAGQHWRLSTGATLRLTGSTNACVVITASGISITSGGAVGGTIDGATLKHCVNVIGTNCTLDGLVLINGATYCVNGNTSSGFRLTRCRITHSGTNEAVAFIGGVGTDFLIAWNSFTTTNGGGIHLKGFTQQNSLSKGARIQANHFTDTSGTGSAINPQGGLWFTVVADNVISGYNLAISVADSPHSTVVGNTIRGATGIAIELADSAHSSATGNTIDGRKDTTLDFLANAPSAGSNVSLQVTNSAVFTNGQQVIIGTYSSPATTETQTINSIIDGTHIQVATLLRNHAVQDEIGQLVSGTAFSLGQNGSFLTLSANTVFGATLNALVIHTNGVDHLTMQGNTLCAPGATPIYMQATKDVLIQGNLMYGGGQIQDGVQFDGSSQGVVSGNILDGYTRCGVLFTSGSSYTADKTIVGPNELTGGTPADYAVLGAAVLGTLTRVIRGSLAVVGTATTPSIVTTLVTNPNPFDCLVYITTGGTNAVTAVSVNGIATGQTVPISTTAKLVGTVVGGGGTIQITGTLAGTSWLWVGLN